jgi:hypothetical protein
MKKVSTAYHNQLEISRDVNCVSPIPSNLTKQQVSDKSKSAMRSLIK